MLAIRDRPFTADELEQMRLLLSLSRDGSGQYLKAIRAFMPDYLAFERATAIVCGGETTENKGIFDVIVPGGGSTRLPFGVSCKMATAQPAARPSWFMELSNSAKKFHDAFAAAGVDWVSEPDKAGAILIELVERWHYAVTDTVDVDASKYLILAHDLGWREFQIAGLDLNLRRADPHTDVQWVSEGGKPGKPSSIAGYIDVAGRRHRLWQFFANSGGQLKYYPLMDWAEWATPAFRLEVAPVRTLREKVDEYWPGLWPH